MVHEESEDLGGLQELELGPFPLLLFFKFGVTRKVEYWNHIIR